MTQNYMKYIIYIMDYDLKQFESFWGGGEN